MNLKLSASYFKLGLITAKEIVKIAESEIIKGSDDADVLVLAGELGDSLSDIDSFYKNALKALNIKIPEKDEAERHVLRHVLTKVITNEEDPFKAILFIKNEINHFEKDSKILGDFLGIERLMGLTYEVGEILDNSIILSEIDKESYVKKLKDEVRGEALDYLIFK